MDDHRHSWVVFILAAAILTSLACSLGSLIPSLGAEPSATPMEEPILVVPGNAPTQAATKPPQATVPTRVGLPSLEPTTAGSDVADVQTGLDKLDSYRMAYNMTIIGKDENGKDATQELKLVQEIVKSKESMHMLMQSSGFTSSALGSGAVEIFQIGKMGYMVTAGKDKTTPDCISFSSDKPTFDISDLLTPDAMIGAIQRQSLIAKGETVNGVKTDHYKVSNASFRFGTATTQSGEVWIAQDGGSLVKFTGTADGDFSLSTSKIKGKANWTYDLTDMNKLKELALPDSCQQASDAIKDLPVPPNATDLNTYGEIITFSSPDSPKVVADYYRQELPAKGWKITKDSNLDTIVMISITKDTRKFQVMITPGDKDQGTAVVITKAQ